MSNSSSQSEFSDDQSTNSVISVRAFLALALLLAIVAHFDVVFRVAPRLAAERQADYQRSCAETAKQLVTRTKIVDGYCVFFARNSMWLDIEAVRANPHLFHGEIR